MHAPCYQHDSYQQSCSSCCEMNDRHLCGNVQPGHIRCVCIRCGAVFDDPKCKRKAKRGGADVKER